MATLSTRVHENGETDQHRKARELAQEWWGNSTPKIKDKVEEIRKKYEQVSVTRDFSDEEQTKILKQLAQEKINMAMNTTNT